MEPLYLYDTRTRAKVAFTPADPANVRLYVCGPTVYDLAHIGNARPILVFDVLFRLLRARYGETAVTYVRNITDVDDKINARAAERGISIRELTETTLADFHADIGQLDILPVTFEPRATENIDEMTAMIDRLVDKGHAYVAADHVLFSVASMDTYGSLSKRSVDDMMAGARVDVAPYKRDPMDFVLWKPSKPGEPGWPSPAGIAVDGRPGWHIECSAMAARYLGETFDIHGGGIDLAFPHHENERAQSCCAFGVEEMASVWMHNGFLQVEGRKMAKSEGNFITIRDALRTIDGDTLRLAMLMTHYRQPIDWTERRVAEARGLLASWAETAAGLPNGAVDAVALAALEDDLNTPAVVARLSELQRAKSPDLGATARLIGIDLGRIAARGAAEAAAKTAALSVDVDAMIAERLAARAAKRFDEADRIRDALLAEGIVLKDGKDATGAPVTTWSFTG
ncbi:cysteine--tRNA ligase [Acuticoccus sp. M5D2P5]|uniref:cysteine--tRNA ligase n=1 Tax=Acuticoccus kalidii TaxID=2910977 RepID=UPI001F00141D|nr:cysteine--tRNA ligase [Acuticoccus kalidii]MCF3935082.1 cysteine--tRNA ligase [Acuticoccus kalidii]